MISFLLPNKNEPNVKQVIAKLEELPYDMEIIICNDSEGKGKGWAIKQGLGYAKGDLICFIDADGDIAPRMVKRLMPFIEDYDIVCGVKKISGLYSRRILTWLSRLYIYAFFGIKCDTQTGIKLFKKEAIQEFYNNGWLFDLEILSVAAQKGFTMCEVPIEYRPGNRKIKLISIWRTFKESITLWLELR